MTRSRAAANSTTPAHELRLARLWLDAELLRGPAVNQTNPQRSPRRGRPHLLLLTTAFPPATTVGALRPVALLHYAARNEWRSSVIALAASGSPRASPSSALPGGRPRVSRIHPARVIEDPPWMPSTAQWFAMALEMFHRGRTRLGSDPPAVIVATAPGFCTFIAGFFLSRFFDAPFILDYRDEWTLRPRFPWVTVRQDDRRWEERCLARADRVLFVTGSLLEQHVREFPVLERGRCRVVRNGWEPRDFGLTTVRYPRLAAPGRTIRIGYFGFMADHQRPRRFLASVARLIDAGKIARKSFRIRIAGIVDGPPLRDLIQFKYPTVLEAYGWAERPRAARMMLACSALLVVNHPLMCRALPTKLFDYLATGRPILVYGDGESEMSALVSRLGAGLSIPEGDDEALLGALQRFRDTPPVGWKTAARLQFLRQHTRERMARRMLAEARAAIRAHTRRRRSG